MGAGRQAVCGGLGAALLLLTTVSAGAAESPGAAEPPERCEELDELRWLVYEDAQRDDRFAVLSGRSFYRTERQILAFRFELDLRRLARVHCRRRHPPYLRRWHAVLRLSSWKAPIEPMNDSGPEIREIHHALGDADPATVTVAEVQSAMTRAGIDRDPAAAAFVFNYLFSPDREATIARARRELSMEQIVAATQYLGYLANQRYDNNKRGLHRPIAPPSQVADAAAAELLGNQPELIAGGCADVANAQAELLQKLGAKDVIVATTAHTLGLHSTVVARDPRSQTYYQFNFGVVARSSQREGADLLQAPAPSDPWVDIGPGIYLNRPNGRTVGYVPTHAGKIYAEAAGMDIHAIEPLARATSSLVGTQLALPFGQSLQTFVARDPTGSFYGGVALTQSWAQGTSFPGTAGLVTAARRTTQGLAVADLYLQVEQRAVTPELRLGGVFRGRVDASLIVIGTYAVPFADVAGNTLGFDAAMFLDGGAQITAGTAGSPLAGRVRVAAQAMPGVTNIAGASPTVFLNHLVLSAEGRARVGRTAAGNVYLVADSALLLDSFGPRLAGGVGVESPRIGVRLEATGRLLADDPTYKEGSLRRGRLLVGVPIVRWLRASYLTEVQEADADAKWTGIGALEGRF
jgi:hypothetical protein